MLKYIGVESPDIDLKRERGYIYSLIQMKATKTKKLWTKNNLFNQHHTP